jgi:hypothetical protein
MIFVLVSIAISRSNDLKNQYAEDYCLEPQPVMGKIKAMPCNGDENQLWRIVYDRSWWASLVRIRSEFVKKCMVPSGNKTILGECPQRYNAHYYLVNTGDNIYIVDKKSRKWVGVSLRDNFLYGNNDWGLTTEFTTEFELADEIDEW